MKIQFCGAARNVTGAQFLITAGNNKIVMDCGLFQGRRQETVSRNKNFLFDPGSVSSLVLSHAHIDHSGNIPNLVAKGFKNSIYSTQPTARLCQIMLKDSASLQQRDIEWINKIKSRKHEPLIEPLYTIEDVEACTDRFIGVQYDKTITIAPGVHARFIDAGHVLGSASIVLEIEERNKIIKLGYTGDIGRPNMPLMHDPNHLRDCDVLLMESTYGKRTHSPNPDIPEHIAALINEVAQAGGKIIIPAFALGRTQTAVYLLHKLFIENRIPEIPIFVDSPMALQVTQVYRDYKDILDRETERIFVQAHQDPFSFPRLTYIQTVEESKQLNAITYPHIIISSSGMLEGGRVLHHLRNGIENHKNLLLFVGYAAENTLARKIMDGHKRVMILGEEFPVKCRIKHLDVFSAHADRNELLMYLSSSDPQTLQHLFLVHGEYDQMLDLKNAIRSKGFQYVHIPQQGEIVDIP